MDGTVADEVDQEQARRELLEKIKDALVIFQGSIDPVVPQSQSDSIVATLRRAGNEPDYHIYEGEGHGFRKPENVIHQHETIEKFLLTHLIYA